MLISYLAIALGGALGGALRYWIGGLVDQRHEGRLPWGTLIVNISGALVAGLLAAAFERAGLLDSPAAAALLVGVCGSYTTVSSFSLQTLSLARSGQCAQAAGYVAGSAAGCLLAIAVGYGLGAALLAGGYGA